MAASPSLTEEFQRSVLCPATMALRRANTICRSGPVRTATLTPKLQERNAGTVTGSVFSRYCVRSVAGSPSRKGVSRLTEVARKSK